MSTSIFKTHYRRGANVLTPEQIEEIRHLKNKVPAYMIVKEYHINKNRVYDIWNDCERLQQDKNYILGDIINKSSFVSSVPPSEDDLAGPFQKKGNNHLITESSESLDELITPNESSPIHESIKVSVQEKQKKKKKSSKPKSVQNSDLPEISTGRSHQEFSPDVSHDLTALIEKDRIEFDEAKRASEKILSLYSVKNDSPSRNA